MSTFDSTKTSLKDLLDDIKTSSGKLLYEIWMKPIGRSANSIFITFSPRVGATSRVFPHLAITLSLTVLRMASAYRRQLSDRAWLNQSIILPNLTQVGSKLPLAMQSVSC